MTKRMIDTLIDEYDYDWKSSLATNIIESLQELVEEYGTSVYFEQDYENDDYEAWYQREETDGEHADRLKIQKNKQRRELKRNVRRH